ncbi:MAG TPA: VWA domain-containing protein [Steroidobacteraceae bacterium]|nr:VWA domain-containing protein [Steroidobacteraceae bacterium]
MRPDFPFSAVVGQEDLKLALILIAVDPTIGGVLISGERGTAKSTAARGLAALLPKTSAGAPAPFVELPIGATEDRVIGSLDLSRVLREGHTELRSGLLARADGGVLYVDEVNLLPDHIVDLLLDAAASGRVTVERDGISAGEAARFVLVGTMNPEEGELRPQFIDRFGLCVQIRGLATHDIRSAAIRQRLAFDDDPASVLAAVEPQERAWREGIVAARARLSTIPITDAHLSSVTALSIEHRLDGIRGDLAIIKTARALAAWQAAAEISDEHIHRAAELALSHRTRQKRPKNVPRAAATPTPPAQARTSSDGRPAPAAGAPPAAENPTPVENPPVENPRLHFAPAAPERPVRLITDAIDRESIGRRTTDSMNSQRRVGAVPYEPTGTLAVADTLSAAARRGARVSADGVRLTAADLRQHELRGPGLCHVLFLVDASGSMATNRRLELAKGAALGLLSSSYQRRDEVALMAFRADGTDLVLPFTRHIAGIERALSDVPTGGRTPLARALRDAGEVLKTREPALLVLFTDGRANVSAEGGDPWEEALAAGSRLQTACAGALVVDCEAGPIVLGRARVLAQALGAECVALDDMDDRSLTIRIHGRLEGL